MSGQVDIPKLDWFERYKRLIGIAWGIILADDEYIYRNYGQEGLAQFAAHTRPQWTGAVAKRLIEKLGFKPTIEDAIKLLGVYSQEVWGFGDPQYSETSIEFAKKGVFTNLACRGWEKAREYHQQTHCDVACTAEYGGVVHGLSPKFKLTVTKARPRGDNRCDYTVEL